MNSEQTASAAALIDAICVACQLDPNHLSADQARAVGESLRAILVLDPRCSAAKIVRGAERYQKEFAGLRVTPRGLARHWSRLGVLDALDFTIAEAASAAVCSTRTIRRAILAGELDADVINQRVIRVPYRSLHLYKQNRKPRLRVRKCSQLQIEPTADQSNIEPQ